MTHRFSTRTSAGGDRVTSQHLHRATRSLTTWGSPSAPYFGGETPRGKVEVPKSRVIEICFLGDSKGATGQREDSEKPFTTSVRGTTTVRSLNSNRATHGDLTEISTRSLNNPYFGAPRNSIIKAKLEMAVVGRRPNRLERPASRHTPSCSQGLGKLGLRNLCTPTLWVPNYLN